jgi:hypothetical protein
VINIQCYVDFCLSTEEDDDILVQDSCNVDLFTQAQLPCSSKSQPADLLHNISAGYHVSGVITSAGRVGCERSAPCLVHDRDT